MTTPQRDPASDDPVADGPATDEPADTADAAHERHQSPHPPFARSPEEYTDPPGHHRRPDGAATDVGA